MNYALVWKRNVVLSKTAQAFLDEEKRNFTPHLTQIYDQQSDILKVK